MPQGSLKEGAGTRAAKVPKRGSIREMLYVFYRDNPGALLGRTEAAEHCGTTLKTIDRVMKEMRDDGVIVRVFGYAIAESISSLPVNESPVVASAPRVRVKAEPLPAEWPRRPVPNSVFQLGQTL